MSGTPASPHAEARARLLRELAAIAGHAAQRSLERCPYRDRSDVCTFAHGCRNQRRRPPAAPRCAGGPLHREPA